MEDKSAVFGLVRFLGPQANRGLWVFMSQSLHFCMRYSAVVPSFVPRSELAYGAPTLARKAAEAPGQAGRIVEFHVPQHFWPSLPGDDVWRKPWVCDRLRRGRLSAFDPARRKRHPG